MGVKIINWLHVVITCYCSAILLLNSHIHSAFCHSLSLGENMWNLKESIECFVKYMWNKHYDQECQWRNMRTSTGGGTGDFFIYVKWASLLTSIWCSVFMEKWQRIHEFQSFRRYFCVIAVLSKLNTNKIRIFFNFRLSEKFMIFYSPISSTRYAIKTRFGVSRDARVLANQTRFVPDNVDYTEY